MTHVVKHTFLTHDTWFEFKTNVKLQKRSNDTQEETCEKEWEEKVESLEEFRKFCIPTRLPLH